MKKSSCPEAKNGLKKNLSPRHVWALAFGCIIGGSAFFMPAQTFLPAAGPCGSAIALTASACVMILIAFNYHAMIGRVPEAGGEFAYARHAFGVRHAFFCAWFLSLSYIALVPLNATLLGVVCRYLCGDLFQSGHLYAVAGYEVYAGEILLSVATLFVFAWMNVRGIRLAGWIQMVLSFALIGGVAVISCAAVFSPAALPLSRIPLFPAKGAILPGILAVMAVSPWAFVGFDTVPQAAEEFNFPARKTRVIMVVAILFGAAVYIALNTVTAAVVPDGCANWMEYSAKLSEYRGIESLPTFHAAGKILGKTGLFLIGIAVISAALAGVVGFYVAASRLLFSMAREGVLPEWFRQLHPRYGTPVHALCFVFLLSVTAPFFGRNVLIWVVDMSSLGAAVGFAYTSAASAHYAIREKRIGMIVSGIAGTFFSLLFALFLLIPLPGLSCSLSVQEYILLLFWVFAGVFFFRRTQRRITGRE